MAIDITNALDRATDGNGAGKLVIDFYVNECSWHSFSDGEKLVLNRTIKRFRRELQAVGFLPKVVRDAPGETMRCKGTRKAEGKVKR